MLAADRCCTSLRTCQTPRFTPPQKLACPVALHRKCGRHRAAEPAWPRLQVDLSVKALFDRSLAATGVTIDVPVPPQTARVNIKKSKGEARYDGSAGVIRWTLPKFRGLKEHRLSADVMLVSTTREKKPWNRCVPHSLASCILIG